MQSTIRSTLTKKGSPIRASVRVTCSELYNPDNSMPALFNPSSLKQHYKAVVGKGNPVGWSQQIKQYSHTEDSPFQLQFHFSAQGAQRVSSRITAKEAIAWYNQFLFPKTLGEAPPLMLFIWPGTLTMIVCVEEVETNYEFWDQDLNVRVCTISLTVSEMRQGFRSQADMLRDGFTQSSEFDAYGAISSSYRLGRSGAPLNLGSAATSPNRRG